MSELVDSRPSPHTDVPTVLVIGDEATIRQLVSTARPSGWVAAAWDLHHRLNREDA
jgi:hypothetical protein